MNGKTRRTTEYLAHMLEAIRIPLLWESQRSEILEAIEKAGLKPAHVLSDG
jgi:hypothetical protein